MKHLASVTWPRSHAGEALLALAEVTGLARDVPRASPLAPRDLAGGPDALVRYLENVASHAGVEAVATTLRAAEISVGVARAAPALLRLPGDAGFLALCGRGRGWVRVLGPDKVTRRLPVAAVAAAMRGPLEAVAGPAVDTLLDGVGLRGRRATRAREALLERQLHERTVEGLVVLRRASFAPFREALRDERAGTRVAGLAVAYAAQLALTIAGWWTLGRGVLQGEIDAGWLAAWLLLLVSLIPARLLSTWLNAEVSVALGVAVKRRILAGALRFNADAMRLEGAGQLSGRAIDASFIDQVALLGGLGAVFALAELAGAAAILAAGAGGWPHALLLACWTGLTIALAVQFKKRHGDWVATRLEMTRDLIEAMVGNRTRLAQLPPERWHEVEDATLERFIALMRRADRTTSMLLAMPRAWQLVALVGLTSAFVGGATPAALAVAVGGIQLAFQALGRLASGGFELATFVIAWERIGPLFDAAERREEPGLPAAALMPGRVGGAVALDAAGVSYTHPGRTSPSLRDVTLRIASGERVLIEGPSGGGKSTLAALLSGARRPTEGLVLAGGLDWPTLGSDGWRRRVAAAPQFHENHILTDTLAFNLLLGRRWPAHDEDLTLAAEVCEELGLGPLLGRMPSGIMQMVGEGGWQLSHGERSRVFLARALLQDAETVILDESFAALDPDTQDRCLETARRRAPTLIVIAHP